MRGMYAIHHTVCTLFTIRSRCRPAAITEKIPASDSLEAIKPAYHEAKTHTHTHEVSQQGDGIQGDGMHL